MATIVLRGVKGSPLTTAEVDANFSNINDEVANITATALPLKADLESPAFTGTPTAPTATSGDNSTQIATTAYVQDAVTAFAAPVLSVAGKIGNVTLTKADVGLSNVTNDAQLKIASNLSDLNNAATARTNLGLGSAAVANIGTSGDVVPKLNAANTFSKGQEVYDGANYSYIRVRRLDQKAPSVESTATIDVGSGNGDARFLSIDITNNIIRWLRVKNAGGALVTDSAGVEQEVCHAGNTGTAVTANVTTSSTDTTAGRLLKVGDFGLGTSSPPLISNINNHNINPGFYQYNSSNGSTNGPEGFGTVLSVQATSNAGGYVGWAPQMFFGTTGGVYVRRNTAAGSSSWSAWERLLTDKMSFNAATATKFATARTINGVSFDGSANITVSANTTQTLTRGTGLTGSNFNGSAATTWAVSYGTTAGTACEGNDSRLSNSRPASDVYAWAKAASKPTYTAAEVGAAASNHTHSYLPLSGGSLTGDLVFGNSDRDHSPMGTYNAAKTQQIWSMGTAYRNSATGVNFGGLYGLAYKHTSNATGGTMAGGHQVVWVVAGTPKCALGDNIWTSGNVTAYSDIRVKTNLEVIPNALEKVQRLNGYTFERTDVVFDESDRPTGPLRQTGVVAQEVIKVLPEAVMGGPTENDPDGHYSVAYGNLVGLLIEAIKEQQQTIEALAARIDILESRKC
jgi:hypothetical protein